MLVADLEQKLATKREITHELSVADLEIADNASSLTFQGGEYPLDEIAEKTLAKYFEVPHTYLKNCPATFKAATLQFWRDEYSDLDVRIETIGNNVVSIHSPDVLNIPLYDLGKVITRTFSPLDSVDLYRYPDTTQFDAVSLDHVVEVPNPEGVIFRPEVGDITHGGIRLLTHPHANKQPSLVPYLRRYVCTNGMQTDEKVGRITIKGNTVEEIIDEIEEAAKRAMRGLDGMLERYASSATMPVPGTLAAFAHQLGKEAGIPKAVMDEVMIIINQLPEDATIYDVNQAFTYVANQDIPHNSRVKLQTLGGSLAFDPAEMVRRCHTCERLI